MEELQVTAAIIAGFVLRIGIPIGLTILLARFLRGLDTRWRTEAEQRVIESAMAAQREQLLNLWLDQPCYTIKHCTPEQLELCRSFSKTHKPCWETKETDGRLEECCRNCEYRKELMLAVHQD